MNFRSKTWYSSEKTDRFCQIFIKFGRIEARFMAKIRFLIFWLVFFSCPKKKNILPKSTFIETMIFFIKNWSILSNFHQIWLDWSPFHDQNSIFMKKYFAHETALESCCDLHSTTEMTGKKSSTTLVLIIFFDFFCQFFHMFGIVSS